MLEIRSCLSDCLSALWPAEAEILCGPLGRPPAAARVGVPERRAVIVSLKGGEMFTIHPLSL